MASRTVTYETRYFNGNWAEQEPADWWHAVCLSTQALLAEVRRGRDRRGGPQRPDDGLHAGGPARRTAPPFDPVLRPAGHAAGARGSWTRST